MIRVGLSPDCSSLLLKFDYHPKLVEMTKQLPGRRFHKTLGGWLLPLTKELVQELPARFPGVHVQVQPDVQERLAQLQQVEAFTHTLKQEDGDILLPKEMVFPTIQPMQHQRRALALGAKRAKFAYLMEMGTGKTFVILSLLRWLKEHQMVRPTLIVAPATVLHVWEDQAKQHQPDLKVMVLEGSVSQRMAQLHAGYVQGVEIFVVNYEAVWRMEDELAKLPWKVMVLDESTRIKARTTKQAKSVLRLGQRVPRRYILTGTPIPNSPLELFAQFAFLDPAILGSHFYAFRDRYAVMGGYQGYQVVAWKNTTELMQKIAGHSYRVLKKDCLDLPEKVYAPIRLDLEGDQKQAYKELAEDLVTEVQDKEVTAPVLVSKLIKLREILAGFIKTDDGTIRRFAKQAKLEALQELVAELPAERKAVIWCQFHEEMRGICQFLREAQHSYVRLDGSTPNEERGTIVHQFQEDKQTRFFVGQQKAGGLGITLTAGTYCFFMTNDYSPETRLQAEDRLHRIGQKNQVTYYDLLCKSTLDVAVMAALRRKQKLSEMLTGDNLQEIIDGAGF